VSQDPEQSDPPAGGLAEELIPVLRRRLGLEGADPAPSEGTILDFAAEVSSPEPHVSKTQLVQLVTFVLGDEHYALPIEQVYEILRVGPITRVPRAPRAIRGLMNVRGRLLPVVETRMLLDMEPAKIDKDTRVVTVRVRSRNLGLLVDRVGYVAKVPVDAILPAPSEVIGRRAEVVRGFTTDAAGLTAVFDLERAFDSDWSTR